MTFILLFSVFVVATCGLIYELISGTLASYLLGDSVTQFSTVIGTYLFAMGVGSYLSKHIHRNALSVFIQVEILIGLIGGFSAAGLFLLFGVISSFRVALYLIVFVIGTLVGLEIPLLMRILQDKMSFKDLVSRVLSFDYIGALVASILFPLVLAPKLGLIRTSIMFGIFNVAVAFWILLLLEREVHWARSLKVLSIGALVSLCVGFAYSENILEYSEAALYPESIIYAKSTPYQRIVLTRNHDDYRLYLNSHLQFDSRDEYRYHEALVHVGLQATANPQRVLVLGGGDGMAVREILKNPAVQSVTLVDLDAAMTGLFRKSELLSSLNGNSFGSSKVTIVNADAFLWLRDNKEQFDFVVVDFPDPTSYSIGKLYSTTFFRLLGQSLKEGAMFVVQSTSPLLARKSFWCVERTIAASGFDTVPYHVMVPSFGEWGYVLAAKGKVKLPTSFPAGLKFLTMETLPALLQFPPDMNSIEVETNKLNNQILVRYYEEDWSQYIS